MPDIFGEKYKGYTVEGKIKIFLGGYVDFPNAQNINCANIARYLDKDKFEVHTMYTHKLPVDKERYKSWGVHLHRVIAHRFIWYWHRWLMMYLGKYDIYYLPKMETVDRAFAERFKGKRGKFTASVEGVVTSQTNVGKAYYTELVDAAFAISSCIADSVRNMWGVQLPILPLGVQPVDGARKRDNVTNVIWVGNIKSNKRPHFLLDCAKRFPQLRFTMIGDGDMKEEIEKRIREECLSNIQLTGRIPNDKVYDYMSHSDLLLMTSEYEGLPKVIQEAAQCGVPSIYFAQNYTVDFIQNGVNGFAVENPDEMCAVVQYLLDHPKEYQKIAVEAEKSIQPYLWPNLIKQYEDFFEALMER